jgi:hypothetical protein
MLAGIRPEREVRVHRPIQNMISKWYLTDDEIVEITLCGERCSFRLRIWRSQAEPAIVLVSQRTGGPSPSWASSQLANLVHQVYLGFSDERMINFEDEVIHGERRLFVLEFTSFGHGLRRHLTQPIRRSFRWIDLEAMVGSAIAR